MSILHNVEVVHNGKKLYKSTVFVHTYETIDDVKARYKRIIAYAHMLNESEVEVIMSEYKYIN